MGELSGKVAIVTGASKGIGAAIAHTFAKAGAAVAVNYASSKADADRVVGEIVKAGGEAVAIQADVANRADVKRLFAETKEKLGRPSVLVNNAGVYSFAPLEEVTEEDFHRQFNTNVLGAILATQEAVKAFRRRGRQRDQFQHHREHESRRRTPSSIPPRRARSTRSRANSPLELAGKGIRVNAIAPGMTETEGFAAAGLSAESAKALGFSLPMGRIGKPEDIARSRSFSPPTNPGG